MSTAITIRELCAAFLAQHEASPARLRLLAAMLRKACDAFGDVAVCEVDAPLVAGWRSTLPPPTRWQATQALKQASAWGARWGLVVDDPMSRIANPRPRRGEVTPFESWEQILRVAEALPPRLALLPVLGAGCGLRPGELLGLDWSSIDLDRRVLVVRASTYERELRSSLKTRRSRRQVPLRSRVLEVLAASPERRASGLVLAGRGGRPLDLRNLRARAWKPAVAAAGLEHPHRIYDLRHTYATWSLRAGVGIYQLARRMGTSVEVIDDTYAHLACDALEHELELLDAFDP